MPVKIVTPQDAAEHVLAEMKQWLRLSPKTYTASVRLFALKLPPERLIEAMWKAQAKKPRGNSNAFRYFCGICHSMIREQNGKYLRN